MYVFCLHVSVYTLLRCRICCLVQSFLQCNSIRLLTLLSCSFSIDVVSLCVVYSFRTAVCCICVVLVDYCYRVCVCCCNWLQPYCPATSRDSSHVDWERMCWSVYECSKKNGRCLKLPSSFDPTYSGSCNAWATSALLITHGSRILYYDASTLEQQLKVVNNAPVRLHSRVEDCGVATPPELENKPATQKRLLGPIPRTSVPWLLNRQQKKAPATKVAALLTVYLRESTLRCSWLVVLVVFLVLKSCLQRYH